jgi:hypothetical protein
MCASGNYKRHDIPDEKKFIPIAVTPEQTQAEMISELMKLKAPQG